MFTNFHKPLKTKPQNENSLFSENGLLPISIYSNTPFLHGAPQLRTVIDLDRIHRFSVVQRSNGINRKNSNVGGR